MVKTHWIRDYYNPVTGLCKRNMYKAHPKAGRSPKNDSLIKEVDDLRSAGLFQTEIAARTGMAVKTVRSILKRTGAYSGVSAYASNA